jgi:hypothetical protein
MLIVAQELDSLNHGDGILIGKVVGWEDLIFHTLTGRVIVLTW